MNVWIVELTMGELFYNVLGLCDVVALEAQSLI
jgi:hypothetical protein